MIWIIVDQLTKSAHLLAEHETCSMKNLAETYVKEIVKIYDIPLLRQK